MYITYPCPVCGEAGPRISKSKALPLDEDNPSLHLYRCGHTVREEGCPEEISFLPKTIHRWQEDQEIDVEASVGDRKS